MAYDVGDVWTPQLTVKDAAGVLTAATVVCTVTSPLGVVTTPAVTTASTGLYDTSVPLPEDGRWKAKWTVSGAVTGVEWQFAYALTASAIVSLGEIKTYLFGDKDPEEWDEDELVRLRGAAIKEVEAEIGGPIEPTTVTAYVCGTPLILGPTATAITSITPSGGTVLDAAGYRLQHGMVYPTYGYSAFYGEHVVVYTAGWAAAVPDEVNQAVLRYIRWSWSRSHGGSESYMPGGDDAVPGLGIDGIRKEIRFVLADLASGPVVA